MEKSSTNSRNVSTINDDQIILDKRPFTAVQEGRAIVDFPSLLDVFYNPVQEFNRDLSIAVLRLFASDFKLIKDTKIAEATSMISKSKEADSVTANKCRKYEKYVRIKEKNYNLVNTNTTLLPEGEQDPSGIIILEALGASGLRSLRYAKEVGGIKQIFTNDYSKAAVDCMKDNIEKNNATHLITPSHAEASLLMYQHREPNKQFNVIDLDPYGSPHIFLDAAVQSISDGGLLLVTCTDMGVLCGKSPETCYSKYGSLSMKINACHEMALRIVLRCLEANANKYGRYIVPLISLSADFYCRLFVKVFTSPSTCKESYTKLSYVHHCSSCDFSKFQRLGEKIVNGNSIKYQLSGPPIPGNLCSQCGGRLKTGGPIWTAPIHDTAFIKRLLKTLPEAGSETPAESTGGHLNTLRRIEGTLMLMSEELQDVPLYLAFDRLFKVYHMHSIKMREFTSAILNAGYGVSRTHACKIGLKTDAPFEFIRKIMYTLNKKRALDLSKFPPNDPVHRLLAITDKSPGVTDSLPSVNFELHPKSKFNSDRKLLKFQMNPVKNWGPKARAITSLFHGDLQEKSKLKQNKRRHKEKDGDKEIRNGNKKLALGDS